MRFFKYPPPAQMSFNHEHRQSAFPSLSSQKGADGIYSEDAQEVEEFPFTDASEGCGSHTETVHWPDTGLWRRIPKEFKLAFLSACVAGLIVHLYVFSNLLLNWDSCKYGYSSNAHLYVGRWALGFFSSLTSDYQLPVVIGVTSIVMIALTAGLTVRILRLSHPASIITVSAFLVSFPTVANTFAYMFTADAYFLALFLNTLAVYLTKKYRFGFLPAAALIGTACGSYQSYICYAIGLFLFDCILSLLEEEPVKAVVCRGLKYILVLAGGLVFYAAAENLLLAYHHISLSSYQGADIISNPDFLAFFAAIPKAYKEFLDYYLHWPFPSSPVLRAAHLLMPVFFAGSLLYLTAAKKLYREPLRLLLGILGTLTLPLALNFITVLAYNGGSHLLMIYAHVLFYVFTVKSVELAAAQQVSAHVKRWFLLPLAVILCSCMLLWNNFCVSNIGYHSLQAAYENSVSVGNRLIARIEALDDFTADTPVALVGAEYSPLGYSGYYAPYSYVLHLMGASNSIFLSTGFLDQYCGLNCGSLNSEQANSILNSGEVAAMPIFPAKGSVAMIDGVAVVRLGERIYIR